jgi:DNA-binding transcriptional MerR regulator
MKRFFIGDIAKRFGLNPRTIRYYETIGILPRAARTESGYRVYSDETIRS